MLSRLDRVLVAVPDLDDAAARFERVLGAARGVLDAVPHLGATRLTLGLGESELELLAPADEGAVASHLARCGPGLFGVGFVSPQLMEVRSSVAHARQHSFEAAGVLWVGPTQPGKLMLAISDAARPRAAGEGEGLIDRLYEVTNPVADAAATSAAYARIFGLDAARFAPIASKAFGYTGTLTLLDPPHRLDRIEVTQTHDERAAMDRFYRRRGEGLYMGFGESAHLEALRARLDAAGARYDAAWASDVLFIHPKSLCGVLLGVSAQGAAWRWSTGAAH